MTEILRSELPSLNFPSDVEIKDVKHLSSYNWIEIATPTIAVPGSPPLWSPPRGSVRVNKDSGSVYVNQNEARNPESALEPLFVALFTSIPYFDIRTTDVVTDRNNILKLLSFVECDPPGKSLEPFAINIEITENTALFSRVKTCNQECIEPGEFRGFGHQFGKVYTRNQIRETSGHHRIVSYRLASMNFVVRHEGVGYTENDVKSFGSSTEANVVDELSSGLEPLSLMSHNNPLDLLPSSSRLTLKRDGKSVPLSHTLAIKTRAIQYPLNFQEVAAQLWLSQTPNLVRAYHRGGIFDTPKVEDVSMDIKRWETGNQVQLKRLAALIRLILDAVRSCGNRASVRYDPSGDKLVISQLDGVNMLPEYLYSRWKLEPSSFNPRQGNPVPVQALQPSQRESSDSIQVGTKIYEIDFKVMPYFKSYLETEQLAHPSLPHPMKHENIPLFDEVYRGLAKGPRELFRLVPNLLSEFHVLCKTLELLGTDVLEGRTLRQLMDDFRSGKDDRDPEEGTKIYGLKSLARDSAFRLVYMLLSSKFASELRDKGMAYNAAFFMVSHPRMFSYKTRKIVLEVFEERFGLTDKQRKKMIRRLLSLTTGAIEILMMIGISSFELLDYVLKVEMGFAMADGFRLVCLFEGRSVMCLSLSLYYFLFRFTFVSDCI
ncbi:geranylgeranyl pyrophosphate synthetase [Xylaria sp. FL0064]|nr:geranylgeranyl pyrophosphate synthetase [Xylaria sp. FL0064]